MLMLTHGGSALVTFWLLGLYHNIEGALLQPRITAHAVGVPGIAVIAALVIGYDVAGIVGMVIAVPTAVLIAEFRTVLRDG